MAEEGEGGLTTAGSIWMKSRLVNCGALSAAERERNEGEKQQSARNVVSAGGVMVVTAGHQGTVSTIREPRDSVPAFLHACVCSSWR